MSQYNILLGDALTRLRELPNESVRCVVTSPPYWGLRDYGVQGQIGLESTPGEYLERVVDVFREVRRVLRSDGTLWMNMGDCYNGQNEREPSILGHGHLSYRAGGANVRVRGLKPKDLVGMPWRLALAMQEDGWYLRQDIIWHKNNPMPESVRDRCTKAHEYIFLMSKTEDYFFDAEAIKEKASINSHSRGGGVNPKAKKEGQHSRMRVDRDPRHTGYIPGNKNHYGKTLYESGDERHRTKVGLVAYAERVRAKQNESFSGAVNQVVTHRNKRSVWTFATSPFKEAHFATFPPALPTICIKAATSEQGCCSVCGRPFNRIIETYETGAYQKMADGWDTEEGGHGTVHRKGRAKGEAGQPILGTRTIGWETQCCPLFGGSPSPCIVLDPFSGAGTTGLAALKLGRSYIGIELNPESVSIEGRRLRRALPELFTATPTQGEQTACTI